MGIDINTLTAAKNYVDETLTGAGGLKGEDGFSPVVAVKESSDTVYKLEITTAAAKFETPNLMASVTVEDTLSADSVNPVQSKAIVAALGTKSDTANYGKTAISVGRKADTDVGENSIAFGYDVEASGDGSQAFGEDTVASGMYAYAEGYLTQATGGEAHAEGAHTLAAGTRSHAEGEHTTAKGLGSHAEGYETVADTTGDYSHSEGYKTVTSGFASHGEGMDGIAWGDESHVEGEGCVANGERSHAEGYCTIAESTSQHVQGKYNVADSANKYAHIVGNGTSDTARSNAHTVDWNGNAWFAGDIYVGGTSQNDGASLIKSLENKANLSDIPTSLPADGGNADTVNSLRTESNYLDIFSASLADDHPCWNRKACVFGQSSDSSANDYIENAPEISGALWYEVETIGNIPSNRAYQLAIGCFGHQKKTIFIRTMHDGNWSNWQNLRDADKPYATGTASISYNSENGGVHELEVLNFTPSFVICKHTQDYNSNGVLVPAIPITNGFKITVAQTTATSIDYIAFR